LIKLLFPILDCRNVNLNAEENVSDINNITSVLKLWFRELPDPLFPRAAYQHFLNAASKSMMASQYQLQNDKLITY
jgi:RhoGAP domain